MKRLFFLSILALPMLLSACGAAKATTVAATQTPLVESVTSTPDPCSEANLPAEIGKINKLMREFDDYSSLASNTPQAQLIQLIPDMQRVLRDAEDQSVPACLVTLKKLQLGHMQTVVQILIGFMNTKDAAGADQINAGIAQARQLHRQYDLEIAKLLGITLVVPPTRTPGAATPEAGVSPAASGIFVTNTSAGAINLRISPDLTAPPAGVLAAQVSAYAVGKTADDQWIQVQIPEKPGLLAWVNASVVQLSVPIASLPVVNQ